MSKHNRALLSEMVRTDFKLRYQGSVLGYLWSLLKPLMLFAILYVVFTKFLRIGEGITNYPLSLLLGIVLWNFFAEATVASLRSIVGKGNLLRKINIPRYMIPVAAVSSAFVNMALNLIVVFIFVAFAKDTAVSLTTLIVFPILLIELIALSMGVGFFLAAIYVKYRDIEHIWEVVRQALFYTIPIIYPLTYITIPIVQKIIILNPLAQILQDARSVITYKDALTISDLYGTANIYIAPVLILIVVSVVSVLFFRAKSKYFAEDI